MSTLAKVFIEDLVVEAIVGVYPAERVTPQRVVVNLLLWVDIAPAIASDAVGDAVDYEAVALRVMGVVQTAQTQLLERLAHEVAEVVLREFTAVDKLRLRLDKPDILPYTHTVGVELVRRRGG
jgi:7,8-dihydroneopterin aldolase/epimerase/oxygenase